MKILTTGGCGFIGGHLVDRLLALGHEVQDVDCLTYAGDSIRTIRDKKSYIHIYKKVQDLKLRHIYDPIDVIYHLAAESSVDKSIASPKEFVETNATGTFNMLCLARELNVKKFIYMSSDETLGHLGFNDPPFTADSPICPRNLYSATKAAGEHFTRAVNITYGLPTITVRSCNAYGPRQAVEKFIPRCITRLLSGKSALLYGNGSNVRQWIHVSDLANGLADLLNTDATGHIVHFSSAEERDNKYIIEAIARELDGTVENVEDRQGHDLVYRLQPTSGFKTKVNFETGIKETIAWYKDNTNWWKGSIARGSLW